MKSRSHITKGFTLVELLVVIAIIVLLAALLLPVLSGARAKAQRTVCISNLRQINLGVRMYSDDANDASPSPGSAAITNRDWLPLYSGYKALMKSYVGLNGASSPRDRLFTCPADVLNASQVFDGPPTFPYRFIERSIHDESGFDFSSYVFNGGDNVTRMFKAGDQTASLTLPGLSNVKLSSVKHPGRTILVAEFPVIIPYSWHDPSAHGVAYYNGTMYNDSRNVASFVDGHVSYIKLYCRDYRTAAVLCNPPESYDYQWTPD